MGAFGFINIYIDQPQKPCDILYCFFVRRSHFATSSLLFAVESWLSCTYYVRLHLFNQLHLPLVVVKSAHAIHVMKVVENYFYLFYQISPSHSEFILFVFLQLNCKVFKFYAVFAKHNLISFQFTCKMSALVRDHISFLLLNDCLCGLTLMHC